MTKKFKIEFFLILLLILSGCSTGECWEGYIYPDKGNLLIHRSSGEFHNLQACESASLETLKSMNALEKGYYECGKNCKSESGYYNRDCEEIVQGNIYK